LGTVIAGERKYSVAQKAWLAVALALAVWAVVIAAGVTLASVFGGGGPDDSAAPSADSQR
jgi:hypothetical protein